MNQTIGLKAQYFFS